MATLNKHLETFGINRFTSSDTYFDWGGRILGQDVAETLNNLREPLVEDRATDQERLAFYDFTMQSNIAGVVLSLKADAIRASGEAVAGRLEGATRILDIGCSCGYLTLWYAYLLPAAAVIGIDVSLTSVRTAKMYANEMQIKNAVFVGGDPRKALNGERFDAIVDTQSVLETSDRRPLLKWIAGALNDHGKFISVPQTGTRNIFKQYCEEIEHAGLVITAITPVPFSDLGEKGAYPLITAEAAHAASATTVDRDHLFDELLELVN